MLITLAEVGGAQSYVRDLVPSLTDEFDVTVAAHGNGPLVDAISASGAEFVSLRNVRRRISPLRDMLGLVELWWLCRHLRPDIVHANSSKAGILGRLAAYCARVPIRVFTAHGWAFKATTGVASSLYLWADRLVSPITSAVVCVSQTELAAGIAARTCRADRASVIHNGIDTPVAVRRELAGEGRPVRIVTVGRLAAPKDFLTLIKAVGLLERGSITLDVLGDGPQRVELESKAKALGPRVTFHGEVSDVADHLARADVFVLSSRSEGLPISVLEAMAAGLPIVASSVGGLAELVAEGRNGYLVPAGDPQAMAAALQMLVADPGLRSELGLTSRRRVEAEFSLGECRRRHRDLYQTLLLEHGRLARR